MDANFAALGFGTLVTSVTMTVFYVMFYQFMRMRYNHAGKIPPSITVYVLAAARIALCLFPQNAWLSADAPRVWGIYRNIPFVLLGAHLIRLVDKEARRHKDRAFRQAWLAIALSFAFYIPVVLFADAVPVVGMLMLPKTVCYVWLVLMGFKAQRRENA
jgi:hypothetical protein